MNVLDRAEAALSHINQMFLSVVYPPEFMQNLPHDQAQAGKCIKCYRDMAHHEMHPPGKITPRAICPQCWAMMTANISQRCWVCGGMFDHQVLVHQQQAPQDLHNRIHGDYCADYFSLVSARALGVDTGMWEKLPSGGVINGYPPPGLITPEEMARIAKSRQITYEPQQTIDDIINMVPVCHPLPVKR